MITFEMMAQPNRDYTWEIVSDYKKTPQRKKAEQEEMGRVWQTDEYGIA